MKHLQPLKENYNLRGICPCHPENTAFDQYQQSSILELICN